MSNYSDFESKRMWRPTPTACYSVAWSRLWPNLVPLSVDLIVGLILLTPSLIPYVGWVYFVLMAPPLYCGLSYTEMKAVRGEPVDFQDLFIGFKYYGQCVGAFLITFGVCFAIGALFLIMAIMAGIGGLGSTGGFTILWITVLIALNYAGARMMFLWEFIIDHRMGPVEAMKASWNILDNSMWTLIQINLLGGVAIFLGVLALVVGILPAILLVGMAQSALLVSLEKSSGLYERSSVPDPITP